MAGTLHIINGDCAGNSLAESGVQGKILICRDMLYDGPRSPGWPDEASLLTRAQFLENFTAGEMRKEQIFIDLKTQYSILAEARKYDQVMLWFDACLCDQSMLVHMLTCLDYLNIDQPQLICIDTFPGIQQFNGLGQLPPSAFASLFKQRQPVTREQFNFAILVDAAFAQQDLAKLSHIACQEDSPLPMVPGAARRWLLEQPDPHSGLGLLETLILHAIAAGCKTPGEIYSSVAAADISPQYWGDTTLWQKINRLAEANPPLLQIEGPADRLPQGKSPLDINSFTIKATTHR